MVTETARDHTKEAPVFGSTKNDLSAADRLTLLRDKVSPAAQRGAEAAKTYAPVAKERAQAAAEWSKPRVEHALERAQPAVDAVRDRAQPHLDHAVEAGGPRVQGAVDNIAPRVDATRDHIVDDWLPKLSAAIATVVAASNAAKDQAGDLKDHALDVSDRAPRALSVLKGESVARRKGRRGKVFLVVGLLSAIGAAVAAVLNRKPKDDPWATPLSDPYTAPTYTAPNAGRSSSVGTSSSTTASVSDLKDTAAETADDAKDKASELTDAAKERASDLKDKADDAR